MVDPDVASLPTDPNDGQDQTSGRSRVAGVARSLHGLQDRAEAKADELEGRVPHLSLLRELWERYRRQNATVLAGHLAFRSFLFLLPLAVLVVAVLGFLNGSVDVADQSQRLGLGRSLSSSVASGAADAHEGRWALAASGLFALGLTGWGLLSAFHYCYAQAWGLEPGKLRRKAALLPKFVGSVVLVILAVAAVGALRHIGLAASLAGILGGGLVVALAFLGIAMVLPHRSTSWTWLLPGTIASTVAMIGLQAFAALYLPSKMGRASQLYGTLGVAAVSLFYLFLLGNVIVGSALVNAVWWDHFHGSATTPDELERLPEPPTDRHPTVSG